MSIPEIFAQKGEAWFRDLETAVLRDLVAKPGPAIVVTGGGAVLRPGNAAMLKDFGTVVWLDAEVETLFERASRHGNRPLLQTANPRATLAEMLAVSRPLYAKIADVHIETTGRRVEEVTDSVLE